MKLLLLAIRFVLSLVFVTSLNLQSDDFDITISQETGAIIELKDAKSYEGSNWVSASENAPWIPGGSRWGLGFADLGNDVFHRSYWTNPEVWNDRGTYRADYIFGPIKLSVSRSVNKHDKSFTETFTFTNNNVSAVDLAQSSKTSFGIYTPFNDHYTNTTDALKERTHAHVWANGGSSSWVKLNQMGGHGRDLGLVLTKGSLSGYSIESRDTITGSNTRGVFVLHPDLGTIEPGQSSTIEWTLFWHDGWDDFFTQAASRSNQFIRYDTESWTLTEGEGVEVGLVGASVGPGTTVNDKAVKCGDHGCSYYHDAGDIGEKQLVVISGQDETRQSSTIYLNTVPAYDDLISTRINFIVDNQQVLDPMDANVGAYVVYDNLAKATVTFDPASDRNAGRERMGMGVLIARWLKTHPDKKIEDSMISYYEFLCTKLQNQQTGFVYDWPYESVPNYANKRLYNWPWMMQIHLTMAALDLDLPETLADKTPLERFMFTVESFYNEGGASLDAIGLPVLEGLTALKGSGDEESYERAESLFVSHGERMIQTGLNYASSEVNFEQSIVAPVAIMLLELYRATGNTTYLKASEVQLEVLLRFAGKQPDYHLHNVAIRHWDGYWFGKDRSYGDTFPHYWSTLNAIALHHYSKATGKLEYKNDADGITRSNLALFDPTGTATCAFLYPLSLNGRPAHIPDLYANDQDWALAHLLQLQADDKAAGAA
ncbi:hypothetical protein V492_07222 [Pseudogymnoascus sp. VKM F-4246]|nr:hypothetical protein V492_07222 [Pseudogymnoascus sp. VKM F-4246]